MCPNCTTTALLVIAGLFLTPWRALIAAFQKLGRWQDVH